MVALDMSVEVAPLGGLVVAQGAHEGLLPSVFPHVYFHVIEVHAHVLAEGALVP